MPDKKLRLRVKAREYGEQQLEALGFAPRMEFELDDGSVVELVHPWLWGDGVQVAYDAAQKDESEEPQSVRTARAVLGTAEHKRFIKGGGKSSQIVLAIEMMRQRITEDDDDFSRSSRTSEPDPKDPQS